MRYVINESRINELALKFLDINYGNLKVIKPTRTHRNYVQFVDDDTDRVYMDGIVGQELLVDNKMGKELCEMFGLNDSQFKLIIQHWTKKNYGMEWENNVVIDRIY